MTEEVLDARKRSARNSGSPGRWLFFAIGVVTFVLVAGVVYARVAASGWLTLPPKPSGDGPDYDALAHSIGKYGFAASLFGDRLLIDTADPQWRELYEEGKQASAYARTNESKRNGTYESLLYANPRLQVSVGRPPLFPCVVSAIYSAFGRNATGMHAVRVFQVVCIALAAALAASLAGAVVWRLTESRIGGVLAGIGVAGLAATNNTLADYATDFLTEPLALLLLQCFVCCVVGFSDDARPLRGLILGGLFFGFAILCRSLFVLWLPAVFLLFVFASHDGWRQRIRNAALFLSVACVVCLPWWIRNYRVTEGYSPLGTKGVITLLGGYCGEALAAGGDWQPEPENALRDRFTKTNDQTEEPEKLDKFAAARLGTQHEVQLARAARTEVTQWITENWRSLPLLVWERIVTHWNPYFGQSLLWKLAMLVGAVVLMRPPGKDSEKHQSDAVWLIGLPIVSTLVTACLYSVGGRFLVPLYGVLMMLAAIATATIAIRLASIFASSLTREEIESPVVDEATSPRTNSVVDEATSPRTNSVVDEATSPRTNSVVDEATSPRTDGPHWIRKKTSLLARKRIKCCHAIN